MTDEEYLNPRTPTELVREETKRRANLFLWRLLGAGVLVWLLLAVASAAFADPPEQRAPIQGHIVYPKRATEWLCERTPTGARTCCGIPPSEARPKDVTYAMAVESCRKSNRAFTQIHQRERARSWRDEKQDYRGCWEEDGGISCPEDRPTSPPSSR